MSLHLNFDVVLDLNRRVRHPSGFDFGGQVPRQPALIPFFEAPPELESGFESKNVNVIN